jgi:hypothetical protein
MGGGVRLGRMSLTPNPVPAPPAADRPAHYRLSTETWELIVKEYREGATAPFLSRKWRVSEHAIRKRVTQHGATKRDWGDAQAIGQALAREAELEEARRKAPEAVAARLFAGVALDEDPATLAQVATLASGRAMKGRLWAEAKALAGLAEAYARLAAQPAMQEEARGSSPQEQAALEVILSELDRLRAIEAAVAAGDLASAAEYVHPDGAVG